MHHAMECFALFFPCARVQLFLWKAKEILVDRGLLTVFLLVCYCTNRKLYKLMSDGKRTGLTQDRIDKLNALQFEWNAPEAAWAKHVANLRAFKEEHGHCNVPLSYTKYPKLGLWVKEKRRHYMFMQQGRPTNMTPERASELEALGFSWHTQESNWSERFQQLKEYKERHGDCLVPTKWAVNPKLGTWVSYLRCEYKKYKKGKQSHITAERIAALDDLGFSWKVVRSGSKADDSSSSSSVSSSGERSRSLCEASTAEDSNSNSTADDYAARRPHKRHRLCM